MTSVRRMVFGKTPAEYVGSCGRCLDAILDEKTEDKKAERAFAKLERNLKEMAVMLYGDGERVVDPAKIVKLSRELKGSDTVERLVMDIGKLDFEIPKTLARILSFWLHDRRTCNDAISYFSTRFKLIDHLLDNFEHPEVTLPCAEVIKEALAHPQLLKIPLEDEKNTLVLKVLGYIGLKDVAYALEAFRMLDVIINCKLAKDQNLSDDMRKEHLKLVSKWLESNYDAFWKAVHSFLEPPGSHLLMEQMLKHVYQILKTDWNYYIMMKYINDPKNLTRVMRLLRVQNKKIQVMAFNVFKIFVANPQKSDKIIEILKPNQGQIMQFFKVLAADDELDGKFEDDLEVLYEQLKKLEQTKTPTISVAEESMPRQESMEAPKDFDSTRKTKPPIATEANVKAKLQHSKTVTVGGNNTTKDTSANLKSPPSSTPGLQQSKTVTLKDGGEEESKAKS
ncbi:hypothetical protein AAMO2058_001152100 [Amorphochlora amoebiformis]